jgi:hypothetical protein
MAFPFDSFELQNYNSFSTKHCFLKKRVIFAQIVNYLTRNSKKTDENGI